MGRKTQKRLINTDQTEICKNTVDRIIGHRTFEPFDNPQVGCSFIRFRRRGDEIEGNLGFPIANYRISTSYPLQLNNGEVVEVVGNKLLHKQIREGELCGQRVRIVYMGREFTTGGHHRKIYRVFKIENQPVLTKAIWNGIIEQQQKNKKRSVRNA